MSLILLIVGIFLVIYSMKYMKNDKVSFTKVLRVKEEAATETDVLIGRLRMEFSETILELQQEILELREQVNMLGNVDQMGNDMLRVRGVRETPSQKDEVISEIYKNNGRTNEISELLEKGFSVEEISEKFQMGRGEILLIKELYQR